MVAAWNVRTMMDQPNHSDRPARRTALIAQELSRYNVDIAALSETRLADEGSLAQSGGATHFSGGVTDRNNSEFMESALR